MAYSTNQFTMAPQVGDLDLKSSVSDSVMTCRFDPSATEGTDYLDPGEGVILADLGASDSAGPPIVGERAADADAIFGARIRLTKQGRDNPGDVTQIARTGAVIFMNAGAAVLRGASVALVLATPGNVVTATTETVFGTALDKASGADELIRVLIA